MENLIEQKILEIPGDPDFGLELKDEFKKKLRERLEKSSKRILYEEVLEKFGQDFRVNSWLKLGGSNERSSNIY